MKILWTDFDDLQPMKLALFSTGYRTNANVPPQFAISYFSGLPQRWGLCSALANLPISMLKVSSLALALGEFPSGLPAPNGATADRSCIPRETRTRTSPNTATCGHHYRG